MDCCGYNGINHLMQVSARSDLTFTDGCNSSPSLVIVALASTITNQLVAIFTSVCSNSVQQIVGNFHKTILRCNWGCTLDHCKTVKQSNFADVTICSTHICRWELFHTIHQYQDTFCRHSRQGNSHGGKHSMQHVLAEFRSL